MGFHYILNPPRMYWFNPRKHPDMTEKLLTGMYGSLHEKKLSLRFAMG